MFVAPAPRHGDVLLGRDVAGRALRVSAHPESGRVVLSIWQESRCLATLRLAPEDVPDLLKSLGAALLACEDAAARAPHAEAG